MQTRRAARSCLLAAGQLQCQQRIAQKTEISLQCRHQILCHDLFDVSDPRARRGGVQADGSADRLRAWDSTSAMAVLLTQHAMGRRQAAAERTISRRTQCGDSNSILLDGRGSGTQGEPGERARNMQIAILNSLQEAGATVWRE